MDETAKAGLPDRLEQLEQVTREYAQYWHGGGWALLVGAALILASGGLALAGAPRAWQRRLDALRLPEPAPGAGDAEGGRP